MSTNELTSKVKELKELKAMADELNAEIAAIEDALKAELTNRNTEEMMIDVFKVRYKEVSQNRFDSTMFKAKYADLYNQFCKTVTYKRFSIA